MSHRVVTFTYLFVIYFMIHSFIHFNAMSTFLGLFHAKRLENCVHCTLIFIFFV